MPDIQHSVLTDPQIHEPKGITTATTQTVYISNGAGSGTWRKLRPNDLDTGTAANNINGWNDIHDSLYTSGSPRAISSGARTKLTNNALDANTNTTRLGSIWSTVNNNFVINDLNSFFIIRINCKVTAAAAASSPYICLFELESVNGPTIVTGNTCFIKGGSNINQLSIPFAFPLVSSINNTALSIFATPDTNINMYDIEFVVQRAYKEG